MILRNNFISEKTDKWIIYSFVSTNEKNAFCIFYLGSSLKQKTHGYNLVGVQIQCGKS